MQLAREGCLDVRHCHFVHLLGPGVQVVQRQVVPGDVGQVVQQLAVAVYAQRKTAYEVVLGGFQFGLGGAVGDEVFDHLTHQLHRLVGLVGPRLQAHGEAAGMLRLSWTAH